jgi:opacity protein-like surface antigen
MKIQVALIAAAAALVAATPAAANEARAEVRGGVAWASGAEEAVAGVALGYDFDLGTSTFAGVEASADKVLAGGANVLFGTSVRAGAKVGAGKLYAIGGFSFTEHDDAWHLGAGYEHKVGSNLYVKGEYRRYFDVVDVNTALFGVGVNF